MTPGRRRSTTATSATRARSPANGPAASASPCGSCRPTRLLATAGRARPHRLGLNGPRRRVAPRREHVLVSAALVATVRGQGRAGHRGSIGHREGDRRPVRWPRGPRSSAVDVQAVRRPTSGVARLDRLDVADPAVAEASVAAAVERFGRLDVLANVAGILRTAHTHEHSPRACGSRCWRSTSPARSSCCKAAIPALLDGGGGAIVNTASTAALAGHPWAAAYSASKGGVLAFTQVARRRVRQAGHPGQRRVPGLDRHADHRRLRLPRGRRHEAAPPHHVDHASRPGPRWSPPPSPTWRATTPATSTASRLRIDGGTLS